MKKITDFNAVSTLSDIGSGHHKLFSSFFVDRRTTTFIILNFIFVLVIILMQMHLVPNAPSIIVLINILLLLAYLAISLFIISNAIKLQKAKIYLEQEKNYNKTLQISHDNICGFRHDFSNIIASIGGYVSTNDMIGLKKYYNQLLHDCQQENSLGSLSPKIVNSPSVYSVLADKYCKADKLGIMISLENLIDFNKLHMEIYEFTRILGILMDNAIEASQECDEKIINVIIMEEKNRNRQLLIIENTYKNKNINVDKIYEKGYSTKESNTGLGLWEVNKIISRHKNLTRFTSKNEKFFRQQIEIYNE